MSDSFDPYYFWLGIPPKDQPPNHYRLLGLDLFESNATAIDNAAERQMIHLRQISTGPRGKIAQELLNQVARARITLLDPAKKAEYDSQLRKPPSDLPAASGPPPRSRAGENQAEAPTPSVPPPIRASLRSATHRSNRSYQYAAISVLLGLCAITAIGLLQVLPGTKRPAESTSQSRTVAEIGNRQPERTDADSRPAIGPESTSDGSSPREKPAPKPAEAEPLPVGKPPTSQPPQEPPELPEKSQPRGSANPDVEPKATPSSDASGEPLLELPATVDLPADVNRRLTLVAAWRAPLEQLELDIVDRFADVETDASYRIDHEPSGTGMQWKIAFVPGGHNASDSGVATLAEMSCERTGGPFVLRRTVAPDGLPAAQQLANCLLRFKQQGKTVMVALRKAVKSPELVLNLHENKANKTLDLSALPKLSGLELQAQPLRDLPPVKSDGGEQSVPVGKPLVLRFNDVPEASIELKLNKTTMNRLSLSIEPVFQVPNGKPQPLTFQQVESTFRNSDTTLAKAKKDLELLESNFARLQANWPRPNQQVRETINRTQQMINMRRQAVTDLQTRDETATKLRDLLGAMDKKASIAYRVVAKVDDQTTLVLLTTDWPEAASKSQLTVCFPVPSKSTIGAYHGQLVMVSFGSATASKGNSAFSRERRP